MQSCNCSHHEQHKITGSNYKGSNTKINHIVTLIQDNFLSPYKILYMIDPKQADHFKLRNKSSGCCVSSHISIPNDQLTKTQKYLKQFINYSYLVSNLDSILSLCNDRYSNIMESGKKDKLEVTKEVEKFILDKVMTETFNNHVFSKLSQRIKEESLKINREIGLWATPATWLQKFPGQQLNFIPNIALSSLMTKGYCVINQNFETRQLFKQLSLLEKDGKFEQCQWLGNQGKSKIMSNADIYMDMQGSNDRSLFPSLKQALILVNSIPFELNFKANLYCTVSPNLHIIFTKQSFHSQLEKGELKYTIILNVGGNMAICAKQQEINLEDGSLFIMQNKNDSYSIKCEQRKQLFILRNFIGCVPKK